MSVFLTVSPHASVINICHYFAALAQRSSRGGFQPPIKGEYCPNGAVFSSPETTDLSPEEDSSGMVSANVSLFHAGQSQSFKI